MIDSQKRFIQIAYNYDGAGWSFKEIRNPGDTLLVHAINFQLSMDEIYSGTGL